MVKKLSDARLTDAVLREMKRLNDLRGVTTELAGSGRQEMDRAWPLTKSGKGHLFHYECSRVTGNGDIVIDAIM